MNCVISYNAKQLDVIKRTIAADLGPEEFDMFVEQAKRAGLDPFKRQIFPLVFSKNNPEKRRVSIVIGIDGYRMLAERSGTYRPDDKPPAFEMDDKLKGVTNPLGIVSCTKSAYKHMHGEWHRVTDTVYWDEYVPTRTWNGETKLDGQWGKMPRVMIAKCCEAVVLRKGWPDVFSGMYAEDEVAQERYLDLTASEAVEAHAEDERAKRMGGRDATVIDWLDGQKLERVPDGQFCDRVIDWAKASETSANDMDVFADRNRAALQDVWVRLGNDALELKKQLETIRSQKLSDESMNQETVAA